ncbi:uncharacterized protein Z520_09203 [Fonsecaea multimorphosa CBS 102226]|uniref:Protein root UVB sensitive/RUS domain-containing protein n=1 Tax=Fonsecaea multimorphosa CBS 102226 TaxID=1442371 RepID=A0A0D2JWL2_9EURO|nr:uncharacterized protein Z520_09203 [Fonsecaea multimorphosa CBS 102226]KIX94894.1 hypothetical protein Z520_09203 [Fonsecaea multimorphosa CBS 102226]OAL20785.1 hypothetical protein AYO22_08555 [Fonsecaea multimorphosa]
MAKRSGRDLEVQDLDPEGHTTVTFRYDPTTQKFQVHRPQRMLSPKSSLLTKCMAPFLPAGYPSSVRADYTPYQIYDSIQAFASTIAGLLASRAVFVGMGVGSEDASLVTTMLLYIAQETIGRVATILFAYQFSQKIEAEVKFYRFFADIVNDMAFILDCLSPGLPLLGRICTLCVSNACRAICGVAGGSSKAILSSHFAKEGNIGELNAKDGSQETVVSLVGMWAGGLLVSKVQGTFETWCCLIPLLAMHLWANWKAVKSVRLTSLNKDRATMLFSALLQGRVKGLNEIGEEEPILGLGKILRAFTDQNAFQVGVSVNKFLQHLPGDVNNSPRKYNHFAQLLSVFQGEDYLLWYDVQSNQGFVLLKESAKGDTQAKALCHLLRISMQLKATTKPAILSQQHDLAQTHQDVFGATPSHDSPEEKLNIQDQSLHSYDELDPTVHLIVETLREHRQEWQNMQDLVQRTGWELNLTNLVRGDCHRIRMGGASPENKKDK